MLSLSWSCTRTQVPVQSLAASPTAFNSFPLQSSSEHSNAGSSSGSSSCGSGTRLGVVVTAAKGNDLHRWCFYSAAPARSSSSSKDAPIENSSNQVAKAAAAAATVQATDKRYEEGHRQGRGAEGEGRARSTEWITLETVENAHEIGVSTSSTH